ncbi:MAG: hypothetical protein UMV23_07345, partial [Halanaerobium sp.]|nr:hypothetical protein [Halanaerobium sp.]
MSNRWGIKELGRRVPVPIAGLMLGLAGAGNLVANYNSIYKALFGIAATSILALLILKAIFDYRGILAGFKNPVIASVAPTFSMAIMILATYLLPG